MFRTLRHSWIPIAVASASLSVSLTAPRANCSAPSTEWPFDAKGIPTKFQADVKKDVTLYLSGVGMRRKNLYLIELDIYLAALAIPANATGKVAEWAATNKESRKSLTNYLLRRDPAQTVKACIYLKPVRDITTSQFLSAMKEMFVDVDPAKFKPFHDLVERVFGATGATTADVVAFYFMENGDLFLSRNGVPQGSVNFPEVSQRLMDIYLDPKRTVTPELPVSIEENHSAVTAIAKQANSK